MRGGHLGAAAVLGAARGGWRTGLARGGGVRIRPWASAGCKSQGSGVRDGHREAAVLPGVGGRAGGQGRREGEGSVNWRSLARCLRRKSAPFLSGTRPSGPGEVRGDVWGGRPPAGSNRGGGRRCWHSEQKGSTFAAKLVWTPKPFSTRGSKPKQGCGSLPKSSCLACIFPLSSFASEGFCLPLERNQLKKKKDVLDCQ